MNTYRFRYEGTDGYGAGEYKIVDVKAEFWEEAQAKMMFSEIPFHIDRIIITLHSEAD